MTTLYIVRHGQSLGNLTGRFLGHTDLDLSETGYKQASKVAEFFENIHIDAVYSSDLCRAFNTVKPIADKKGLCIIPRTRLREVNSGKWENNEFDYLKSQFAEDYGVWLTDIGNAVCTEGESVAHLQERVATELAAIAKAHQGETVVIGTHATPIRAMTCIWRGLTLSEMKNIPWVANASITKVIYEDGVGKIEEYEITEHLGDIFSSFGTANV
ncbi:MAG: histidine phosphatase family protein [Clostridia bacterium]|nr:histidine phosphatase family protein [Clostridia bacterium]